MKIRVIDTETTGFPTEDDKNHRIVEIGWSDLVIDGESIHVGSPFATLVFPGRDIPPESKAVHHITEEMCAREGIPPEHAFRLAMTNPPDYWCAHNVEMERAFFGGGEAPWLCTYRTACRVWPDAPSHSNSVLRYWLGLDLDPDFAQPAHRAGPDAYVTAHILREILITKGATLEEMVRWAKGPPLLPRITFGKHKGARWEDVPTDYLVWVRDKSDLDAATKASARHWLKQRKKSGVSRLPIAIAEISDYQDRAGRAFEAKKPREIQPAPRPD